MDKRKEAKKRERQELKEIARDIRKEYFMSLVPLYVILSYYLMQAGLNDSKFLFWNLPFIDYSLSVVGMIFALFLTYASFFRIPQNWVFYAYLSAASLGAVGALVFSIDWLNSLRDLMTLNVSAWYLWIYVIGGEIVILAIILFHVMNVIKVNNHKTTFMKLNIP